ncbi:MAG: VanZ family protein [Eubacteriales bacterium]|nr:VanZ family protein [Eubacteriales bacterium]
MYQLMMSDTPFGMFLQVVPITLLVGIIYAVIRFVIVKKRNIPVAFGTEFMRLLFICYLTGLINLVLVPTNLWTCIWFFLKNGYKGAELYPPFSGGFNFVPSLIKALSGELVLGSWVKKMLIGNILMFVPLGFFLPFVSEKLTGRNIIKIAAIVPATVEIIQLVVGRSFDVDDLLMNFAGIVIGYFAAVVVKTLAHKMKKKT